jgi:UDP-N-acetylmuramate dehydrogenase
MLDNKEILNNLEKIISKEKIKQNEPMKEHTSLKIGGPAEIFVRVSSVEELKEILKLCKTNKIPLTIVGNGSNILVLDKGIKGIVIKTNLKEIKIKNKENENIEITVDDGVQLGFLAQKLLKEEITGFEELSGIPGTIGGAIVMNAGAHGKEMKDIVTEITAIDYSGNIHIFTNEQAKFEYRNSIFSTGEYIILQVKLLLKKGNKEEIKLKMNEYAQYRKEKQPIEYPSAGSTFKRGTDFVTAKLIDDAGLKGYSIGGAKVSEKHAGFVINTGNATAKDIIELVKYVQDKVYEKFGKKIELEIKILGEK